jgi:membrane-associated protease RseP (regulator of RpoE activity)
VAWGNLTAYEWLTFYLALMALLAAFTLAQAFVGSWVGLAIEEISFGFGPAIARRTVAGTVWALRPLPLGSSVKFAGTDPANPPAPGVRGFQDLRLGPAALVLLCGPLAMAALGAALAGTSGSPPIRLAGAIGVYAGLVNLLPVPTYAGGQLLLKAVESARGRPLPDGVLDILAWVGIALSLAVGTWFVYTVVAHPEAVMQFRFPFPATEAPP